MVVRVDIPAVERGPTILIQNSVSVKTRLVPEDHLLLILLDADKLTSKQPVLDTSGTRYLHQVLHPASNFLHMRNETHDHILIEQLLRPDCMVRGRSNNVFQNV